MEIHFHFHEFRSDLEKILHVIDERGLKIMASQAELIAGLNALTEKLKKIGTETASLKQKIADLETAVQNAGTTTPEVDAALKAAKDQAQIVDDQVADAPGPGPVVPVGNV